MKLKNNSLTAIGITLIGAAACLFMFICLVKFFGPNGILIGLAGTGGVCMLTGAFTDDDEA